jgi:hypothetical protein
MTARRRAAAPRDAAPPPAAAAGGGAHPNPYPTVAVVVLGDVGRSPRMQYHCASLAAHPRVGGVSLVGYAGERCVDAVEADPRITQYLLGSPFARLPRSLFLLWAPLKVVYQVAQLLWTLLVAIPTPSAILVQNPPRCAIREWWGWAGERRDACVRGERRAAEGLRRRGRSVRARVVLPTPQPLPVPTHATSPHSQHPRAAGGVASLPPA